LCFGLIALAVMTGCVKRPFRSRFREGVLGGESALRAKHWKDLLAASQPLLMSETNAEYRRVRIDSRRQQTASRRYRTGATSDVYYHVTLEDGRSGYIDAFILVTFATDIDPAQIAAECKKAW
jgi:hypothetical protein